MPSRGGIAENIIAWGIVAALTFILHRFFTGVAWEWWAVLGIAVALIASGIILRRNRPPSKLPPDFLTNLMGEMHGQLRHLIEHSRPHEEPLPPLPLRSELHLPAGPIAEPRHAGRRRVRRRIEDGQWICERTSPYDPYWVSHYPPEERDAKWEEGLRGNIPYRDEVADWHAKNIEELTSIGFGAIHLYPSEEAIPDDYRWYRTWVERRIEELERIEDLL